MPAIISKKWKSEKYMKDRIIKGKFSSDKEFQKHLKDPSYFESNQPTKETEEKYVLFIDILGFKDLVTNNSTDELRKIFENQVIETYGIAYEIACSKFKIPYSFELHIEGNILNDVSQDQLNLHIMSDSITIWTKNNSQESLYLLCSFSSIFLGMTLMLGVPLRGGISKGDIIVFDKSMNNINQQCIMGKGLVNANNLEKNQKWMGAIVDHELIDKTHSVWNKTPLPIVNYNVPFGQDVISYNTINWTLEAVTNHCGKEDGYTFFENKFKQFNKTISHPSVIEKIQNTYSFFENVSGIK